jgi:hypothetical protein
MTRTAISLFQRWKATKSRTGSDKQRTKLRHTSKRITSLVLSDNFI